MQQPVFPSALPLARCLTALLLGSAALGAQADVSLYSDAYVTVGNRYDNSSYSLALAGIANSGTLLSNTGNYSATFNGLNLVGQPDSEVFVGQAQAQAGFGALRAQARYTLNNAIANAANVPFVNPDFSTNGNGVPSAFAAHATAFSADDLTVSAAGSGASSVAYLQFSFRITGNMGTTGGAYPYSNFVQVFQNDGRPVYAGGAVNLFTSYTTGPYDTLITSARIPVVNGQASFGLMLYTEAGHSEVNTSYLPYVDRDSSGSVDFFNTLHVVSASGFAADNSAVPLDSVVGASGLSYAVSAVPEPAAWALMLGGVAVLAWRCRGLRAG